MRTRIRQAIKRNCPNPRHHVPRKFLVWALTRKLLYAAQPRAASGRELEVHRAEFAVALKSFPAKGLRPLRAQNPF